MKVKISRLSTLFSGKGGICKFLTKEKAISVLHLHIPIFGLSKGPYHRVWHANSG